MPARKASAPAIHPRILLVDDHLNGLKARTAVLEELGYRITAASGGEDALEHFGQQKFELVVTDYKMPRMDGIELIVRLRKKSQDVPVILISGYADALGLNEANTGADAVIQKSAHEVSHLVRTVARLLRQKPKPARKPAAGETPKSQRKTV